MKILTFNIEEWFRIERIDILYTDSYSDHAFAKIANRTIIANGNNQTICDNIDKFKRYFNK